MNVLSDKKLQSTERGLDLALRLPWYRGLPLSTVEIKLVRINGETIDTSRMTLGINDQDFRLDQLAEATRETWFVLDSAALHIEWPGATRGREYDVEVILILYPPYIPGLAFPSQARSRMRAC